MKKHGLSAFLVLVAVFFSLGGFAGEAGTLEGVVNVNAASAEQLMLLPGIGEAKAELIIAARSQKPFASNEDLLAVKGIGEKTLSKWESHIAFEGESTIKNVKSVP